MARVLCTGPVINEPFESSLGLGCAERSRTWGMGGDSGKQLENHHESTISMGPFSIAILVLI